MNRYQTLSYSSLASLSAGTNYLFSTWAPQLSSQLILSSTQTNVVGLAGNLGVYLTGPFVGRIVDANGPRLVLFVASFCLAGGYAGLHWIYTAEQTNADPMLGLILANALTGVGSACALSASVNAVAKCFPVKRRSTAMSIVMSAFGLSAFFYTNLSSLPFLRSSLDADPTPSFLLVLSFGTGASILLSAILITPPPPIYDTIPDSASETPSVEASEIVLPSSERNVTGFALLREIDFCLLFAVLALLSGIGLMYINNIGEIARSITLGTSANEVLVLQSHLVSILSVFNFLGRLVMGIASDYFIHRVPECYRISHRVYFAVPCSALFLVSQLVASRAETPLGLMHAAGLTGLVYGMLFGLWPTLILEYFGIASFSANNGLASLAPAIGGNVANLVFGRIVDSHIVPPSPPPLVERFADHQCMLGRECYLAAFTLTQSMAVVAILLSLVLALRAPRKAEPMR